MKDNMLLVVPSRSRPASIARLREAMASTCRGDTCLLVGLDDDDPQLPEYLALESSVKDQVTVEPDLHQVVAWINRLALPNVNGYKYIGHIGDDNVPSTIGWDVAIMEALEKTPFAFGNDLYPSRIPGTLCCHVFTRSSVIKTLGYFGHPSIAHMYVDVQWMALGVACGITFLPEQIIEHLHYTTGRSPQDASYQASFAKTADDLLAWHAYCRSGQLNIDIEKLGGNPFTDEHLAAFNRDLNIPGVWPG